MATALQQQLAAIAANSTHQLDLKAQKARHGKSLLFEPRDAAAQSFDTIYQLCYEGFEELCMLDSRFSSFGRNLFSVQSKNEDRTQMIAAQNEELDKTIVGFLGLVGGRLLLKPATKAVEWLVRRFRVEEYNTEALLLTYLPYHTSHIFPTLLSILPEQLPATFKFLHPYVASLQCPPRHAVLSAAINNLGFFSALSQYVLRVSRARHQSAVLIGFWASITAQAVGGMIDASRSGRESIRKQREEDILLKVLPIVQSAMSVRGVPELYLAACMIMTILATKASLDDKVIDAMMEAAVGAWTEQTLEDGLTCLSLLAEEKHRARQPRSVTKAVLNTGESAALLIDLSQSHKTDKLLLGSCLGAIDHEPNDASATSLAMSAIDDGLLSKSSTRFLIEELVRKLGVTTDLGSDNDKPNMMVSILSHLASRKETAEMVVKTARRLQVDLGELSPRFASTSTSLNAEQAVQSPEPMEIDEVKFEDTTYLNDMLGHLPNLDGNYSSFLDATEDGHFEDYLRVFEAVQGSAQSLDRFLSVKSLQGKQSEQTPQLLSFLMRASISGSSPIARARAFETMALELRRMNSERNLNMQALIPYAIVGLADPVPRVRRGAAALCFALDKSALSKDAEVWCAVSLYDTQATQPLPLPASDAWKLWSSAILSNLESCLLDGEYVVRALADVLNASQSKTSRLIDAENKHLKGSLRSAACTFLARHAAATPALKVKLRLLSILHRVGKVGNEARKGPLLDLVIKWVTSPADEIESICSAQQSSVRDLDEAIIGSLSHRSAEELQTLKEIASGSRGSRRELSTVAFGCLRKLWTAMKTPSQVALVAYLLDIGLGESTEDTSDAVQSEALDTLRALDLPADVAVHLLDSLPNAADHQEQLPPAKKQRTSKSDVVQPKAFDSVKLNAAIRRITLALELVEAAKPERHPGLLKGLFHLLGELHHYRTMTGSQLVYLQGLVIGCLLSVVDGLNSAGNADVDRSVIRADLIVECVRTTSSTQVHNSALLLVSSLASWAPELVLHSVMPLFTFMSSTLLKQSDEFSAHVTDQTVARIVPPLAASLKKKGKDLVIGTSELLLSFTAAFEHIPLHRRARLFQHLVQTLGPEDALFAVVAMLIERYPEDNRILPFVSSLMDMFPVTVQLQTMRKYLDLVSDGLKPRRGPSDIILGFAEKSGELIEDATDTLLESLAQIMRNQTLRKRVAKEVGKSEGQAETIQSIYAQLLSQTMQLARDLSHNDVLKTAADAVLESLLLLTPTKDFIESSAQLMRSGSDETRQQVFRSLEARVITAKKSDAVLQSTFLEVLPNCCAFIREDQPVATRHAAITCIDQIVEKFGKRDREAVSNAATVVAGGAALCSDDRSLRTISILCLASIVEVLGDEFVPTLPKVLSVTFDYLEGTLDQLSINRRLHSAGFAFATAVLDHVPWMLSAKYLDRALTLAAKSVSSDNAEEYIVDAAVQFCALAAQKVSAQECFASIDRTWTAVATSTTESGRLYLDTVHQAIQQHSKTTITSCSQVLFAVILQAFDLRRDIPSDQNGDDDTASTYHLVNGVALDMTLKLNDATFRPFFIRLVEWALNTLPKSDAEGRRLRATSLYSFALALFEQLKSIVTSYTSFLLDSAASALRLSADGRPEDQSLVDLVLQTFSSSFRHDQDDFWQAPAHFDTVASPMISLLARAKSRDVTTQVVPAICELAAAAASPEHHKTMNTQIMAYMRHQDAAVRLAAVKCERAITDKVQFDWLGMLPEMLPFISELQEDDDEAVERETLRWVKQIEDVTGESMDAMLQ